jgi:hypothetical protein
MATCRADPSIPRQESGGFKFPLGAYPIEPMAPKPGYTLQFEPADGGDEEGDWEEWPDRYIFDAVVSADRVQPLCQMLIALLPGRVFPILDILGQDAYREIDPYIAYDLVGTDHFIDAVRRFRDFMYEDGMVGFGALAEEPFYYLFVDEHKIVTIRAEPTLKERVERILHAFDLEQVEDPAGVDAAAHEHRGVLAMPQDEPHVLGPSEILESLRDEWQLVLNIDPDTNLDEDGNPLGTTAWRSLLRCEYPKGPPRYAEVLLRAPSLRTAEETAFDAIEQLVRREKLEPSDVLVVTSDRLKPEQLGPVRTLARKPRVSGGSEGYILSCRWLPD